MIPYTIHVQEYPHTVHGNHRDGAPYPRLGGCGIYPLKLRSTHLAPLWGHILGISAGPSDGGSAEMEVLHSEITPSERKTRLMRTREKVAYSRVHLSGMVPFWHPFWHPFWYPTMATVAHRWSIRVHVITPNGLVLDLKVYPQGVPIHTECVILCVILCVQQCTPIYRCDP